MKKFLALTLSLLLILSLAACGTSGETTQSASSSASTAGSTSADASQQTGNSTDATPSGDPVRVGITTVLTGDRSLEGEYAKNAAVIIQQEINDAGGVLGRPLELVIEDALGTDVGAVNAYRKLAADDSIVAIIGSNSSNDNIAISGSVLEFEIMTTAQGSSPKLRDLCNNENSWMFQLRACDETLCGAMIKYAVEELGLKTFAVIHDTETASSDQARLFTEALAKYDIEPSVVVPFTSGTKDYSSHLAQIQNANVDAILAASFHTEAAILMQQMRSMGIEQPVFGSNAYCDPVTIGLAQDAMNGVYSVTSWIPNTTTAKGEPFSKKYTDMYGVDCAFSAAQIYDHVSVVCEAINRAGTTDRQAVRDAMQTISDYEGAITVFDCRTNGDCGRGGLVVQVKDMVPEIVKSIYSEKVF